MGLTNEEKRELARIVKSISDKEVKEQCITALHETYAMRFNYSTFRSYLKALRGR